MKTKDNGGPAFPRKRSVHRTFDIRLDSGYIHDPPQNGMSLRDWFAGMALQGILAGSKGLDMRIWEFSNLAYEHADAMLAERSKHDDAPSNIS